MGYQLLTNRTSPNYSRGRHYPIKFIVIHHWGARGQKFQNVVNWLCRPGGTSSAHYVVEAGKVACIVNESDRAWHAGSKGNPQGIGIECRPEATDGDYETVAQLIADIRRRRGDLPLYPHRHFMNTACPGVWDLNRLDQMARGLNVTNNQITTETERIPNMMYIRDEVGRVYSTDGIFARWVGGANILNQALAKGVPLISATNQEIQRDYVIVTSDFQSVPQRVRNIQDAVTGSPASPDWIKRTSVLGLIQDKLGISRREQ